MSKKKNVDELNKHKFAALNSVSNFIDANIGGDHKAKGRADKFCYWLEDYVKFLDYEPIFRKKCKDRELTRYKRGEIIKAHLGYNIGSEEGGLHYCVVLEKNNTISNPVITVVPLTSVKPDTDLSKLKNGSIFLGNELFTATSAKLSSQIKSIQKNFDAIKIEMDKYDDDDKVPEELVENIETIRFDLECCEKTRQEFERMKSGSIALVNQITTISKIRIYDPKSSTDPLSGIKLSNEKLNLIDEEIIRKYTK